MSDRIQIETTQGTLTVKLFPEVAPKTCENFRTHVQNGYYDGIVFHRIIKQFMIQGGDPTGTGRGGESIWGKPFGDECKADLKFDRPYLLAMANAGPAPMAANSSLPPSKLPGCTCATPFLVKWSKAPM